MQNLLRSFSLIFLLLSAVVNFKQLFAQCPGADRCVDAMVFCSLGDLNGLACHNTNTVHYPCETGCWKGGPAGTPNWWGFTSSGGVATISMSNGCDQNDGFRWGINEGDCCGYHLYCTSGCDWGNQKSQFTYNFKPCKTYYLWVLDCGSVSCDFTVSAAPALGPPSLSPMGLINNDASGMVGPICEGGHTTLFINPQPGACDPYYVWTIDGKEFGQPGSNHDDHLILSITVAGDYVICVTAIIGNHWSGSICDQQGPVCTTLKVRHTKANEDQVGAPRKLCKEGTFWHGQKVDTSGTYRANFRDVNGCYYDSVVEFILQAVPDPGNVYYITCNNSPFIDIKGRSYFPCINNLNISLPKSTNFGCDSSIILTAINVDFTTKFKIRCFGGLVEISPNVSIVKLCNLGESYRYNYKWYIKNDPSKKTISTDEFLLVSPEDEEYCLEVDLGVTLGTTFATCAKSFCESFKESDYKLKCFSLKGDSLICNSQNGFYQIDSLSKQKVNLYSWNTTGGTIVSKTDSSAVEVRWDLSSGDTGKICASYLTDCGTSCEKCLNVLIGKSSSPYAGPDDSICNLINTFQGKKDNGGHWSQILGPGKSLIADSTDPTSNIVVDKFGLYRYVYSELIGGCNSTDTVDLYFNSKPDSSSLVYICNSKQSQYKLHFLIKGGTPPYSIVQGNGNIDANNYYNSNYCDNLTGYTILIRDVMGCILNFNFSHDCNCTNSIRNFDKTPELKCEDQAVIIQVPLYTPDLNDTLIYVVTTDPDPDNAATGTFIKILSSTTVLYDASYMNFNTTYYIIVLLGKKNGKNGIDFLADCVHADGPKSFVFYQNPFPYAGFDDAICGTTNDLKGVQSINGSDLKWKLISGNAASITDDTLAATSVNTNGQYGTYIFELTEDNHTCIAADRVTITFNPSPFIAINEKICIDYVPPYPYKATIKIANGQPPFTILQGAGSISGNIYTTDTLSSLTKFNVELKDANGCISNLIIDDYNCNCGNINAGQLDTALDEVCVDQCVTIKSLLGEITDPEDAVIYVLHQSSYNEINPAFPKIDTFYSVNDLVCFHQNQMITGRTYYITRVVGDSTISNGKKIVKDNDPCKRVTANQPIIWYNYPKPDAGPNDSVCFFNYQLNGITNTGTPSWRFLSGPGQSNIINPNNDVTNVNVDGKGTYLYELSENFKSCIAKDTVTITYWDAPSWTNQNPPECDNAAEHYRISVDGQNGDRPSWIINGYYFPNNPLSGKFIGANTWRTDWIPNNDVYRLILNDRHNCLPDTISNTYECPCINSIGNLDKTPIILCIDKIAIANYTLSSGNPDGNDVVRYVLLDGNPADPKSGNLLSFNANGIFVFDQTKMQAGKTYYIAVFMGNMDPNDPNKVLFSDRCLKFDVVPVIWYDYPVAKITGADTLTCSRTPIILDGNSSTSGSGSPLIYAWSTVNGKIVGSTSNSSAIINSPGDYKLFVTDPISKCTHEVSYNIKIDVTRPSIVIIPPQILSCDRTSVKLDASASSQGNEFKIQWTGPGNIANANSYIPSVDAAGRYQLKINNSNNGCVDSLSIIAGSDFKKPIPLIQQIGQLSCNVKQVQLNASGSKGQSGQISSYSWSTTNGSIITGLNTSTITIDKPGRYQLVVKDQNNGCDSITNLNVLDIGNPLAGIDLNTQDPKCFGEQNGEINVNGIIANGPLNGLQYSFNNGAFGNSTTFSNLSQGIYHLNVKDNNGCEHDTTVTLIEPGKLGIQVIKTITVDLDTPVNLDSMILSVTGGTKNYQDTSWLNINQNTNWPNVHYLADTTRDFLITVIDAAGCMIQDRVKVIVRIIKDVWWPNAFSPNGDGTNDIWNIKGKRINTIRTLNIYDRWGELVFSAQNIKDGNIDPTAGWDGIFKGQKALPGVYVFYAEIEYVGSNGFDKYKGEFALIR